MASDKYVTKVGKRHTHIFQAVLNFDQGDQISGSLLEATAVLQEDKDPAELANQRRSPLPFTLTKADLTGNIQLVDLSTDEDGKIAYTQAKLNSWAAALQEGNIPLALVRIGMHSMFRGIQRKRDNPPPVEDPRNVPV